MVKTTGFSLILIYIFRNLPKNAKNHLFSPAEGGHMTKIDKILLFLKFSIIGILLKKIEVIVSFTKILEFFEKIVIFLLSIHSLYKNAI